MHEAHSVENLAGYLVPKFCVPPAFREKQVKAVPVHPFHLQTNAKLRVIVERVVFSDIGMIEAVTDFILLTEHIPVERIVAKLRPDAFDRNDSAVPRGFVENEGPIPPADFLKRCSLVFNHGPFRAEKTRVAYLLHFADQFAKSTNNC